MANPQQKETFSNVKPVESFSDMQPTAAESPTTPPVEAPGFVNTLAREGKALGSTVAGMLNPATYYHAFTDPANEEEKQLFGADQVTGAKHIGLGIHRLVLSPIEHAGLGAYDIAHSPDPYGAALEHAPEILGTAGGMAIGGKILSSAGNAARVAGEETGWSPRSPEGSPNAPTPILNDVIGGTRPGTVGGNVPLPFRDVTTPVIRGATRAINKVAPRAAQAAIGATAGHILGGPVGAEIGTSIGLLPTAEALKNLRLPKSMANFGLNPNEVLAQRFVPYDTPEGPVHVTRETAKDLASGKVRIDELQGVSPIRQTPEGEVKPVSGDSFSKAFSGKRILVNPNGEAALNAYDNQTGSTFGRITPLTDAEPEFGDEGEPAEPDAPYVPTEEDPFQARAVESKTRGAETPTPPARAVESEPPVAPKISTSPKAVGAALEQSLGATPKDAPIYDRGTQPQKLSSRPDVAVHQTAGTSPEQIAELHKLTNAQLGEMASKKGIDMGARSVSRAQGGTASTQISRADLFKQLYDAGVTPDEMVEYGRNRSRYPNAPIDRVDEYGNPKVSGSNPELSGGRPDDDFPLSMLSSSPLEPNSVLPEGSRNTVAKSPSGDEVGNVVTSPGHREGEYNVRNATVTPSLKGRGLGKQLYTRAAEDVAGLGGSMLSNDPVYTSPEAERVWWGLSKNNPVAVGENPVTGARKFALDVNQLGKGPSESTIHTARRANAPVAGDQSYETRIMKNLSIGPNGIMQSFDEPKADAYRLSPWMQRAADISLPQVEHAAWDRNTVVEPPGIEPRFGTRPAIEKTQGIRDYLNNHEDYVDKEHRTGRVNEDDPFGSQLQAANGSPAESRAVNDFLRQQYGKDVPHSGAELVEPPKEAAENPKVAQARLDGLGNKYMRENYGVTPKGYISGFADMVPERSGVLNEEDFTNESHEPHPNTLATVKRLAPDDFEHLNRMFGNRAQTPDELARSFSPDDDVLLEQITKQLSGREPNKAKLSRLAIDELVRQRSRLANDISKTGEASFGEGNIRLDDAGYRTKYGGNRMRISESPVAGRISGRKPPVASRIMDQQLAGRK